MTSCKYLIAFLMVVTAVQDVHAAQPLPFVVQAAWPDALEVLSPSDVSVEGWLGNRVILNEKNRLAQMDLEPLLAGFRQKPGVHPWIGEHIGKWMHAATLAWANTADPQLRGKLDYAAAELIKAQEPDGYLGTYIPGKRFGLYDDADWDVWAHKYNLIGLLTYYQYTGNQDALNACRRIGDLLIDTFPAKRSIIAAGTHVGMAATSVLEPMVLLYRLTGDERYLTFCRYIVTSWSEPDGPKIMESLLEHGQVNKTANRKAYEMLSNLVGLCELARATGDRGLLKPVLNAWKDIVDKHLYITGACSQGEQFHDDYDLPNHMGAHVGEQCVTTTWIQLNWQLLRLTGETRFGHQLEKTFYNQLSAAQRPDGRQWCYFTSPEGTKPYGPGISCCVSSGPRGMALVPQSAVLRIPAAPDCPATFMVNLWDRITVNTQVGVQDVILKWETDFPHKGRARLNVQSDRPMACSVRIRIPAWAQPCTANLAGGSGGTVVMKEDTLVFTTQDWTGVTGEVTFHLGTDMIVGDHGNTGRCAFSWGPFVLAYDQGIHINAPVPRRAMVPTNTSAASLQRVSLPGTPLRFTAPLGELRKTGFQPYTLVPYAEAGADGTRYAVWLHLAGPFSVANQSLFSYADESRNAPGGEEGSIADNDADTFVVTFNEHLQPEAWFAVEQEEPQTFNRIVFMQGPMFHDGGWFDVTGGGKPQVQIKCHSEAAWETVAHIADYPQTTSTRSAGLTEGQTFTVNLPKPVKATALRVIGRAACGDSPSQSFASCAELQAFEISSSGQGSTIPNIMLIMADDMGFSDLGCYGGDIRTPNLDGLAANGLRFTQFYNGARCCPTRASLLTGLHPAQAGIRWMNEQRGLKDYYGALSTRAVTIAEALKPAGYATYMAGKWHVSGHDRATSSEERSDWPCQRGFDHFYGTLCGAGSYFNPSTLTQDNEAIKVQGKDYYYTDAISDRSVQFIQAHHRSKSNQPFFLYVAYTAPHSPLHAPEEMIAKYRGHYMKGWDVLRQERYTRLVDMGIIDKRWNCSPIDPAMFSWDALDPSQQEEMDLRMAVYAAQVEIMDQGIGRIIHMLEQIHQLDNTLIFFLSDNGASQEGGLWGRDAGRGDIGTRESRSHYGLPWANLSNTPFRHYKRWIHEGGVATPLIVHWPRGIKASGELRHQLGHINDIMATCVDVAEVAYPTHHHGQRIIPCEGLSLTPVFANKDRTYPMIGWEHEGNRGVRKGKWKLVALRGEASELYDMTKDRTELHNLADRFPEKVEELEKEYRAWAERCGIEPWKWPVERNMKPVPAR